MEFDAQRNVVFLGWIFCEGENESTRDLRCGQSQIVVQFRNFSASLFVRVAKLENAGRLATRATMSPYHGRGPWELHRS
jgi:hypothetical protein